MQHASRSGIPLMLIQLLGGHPHEVEVEVEAAAEHASHPYALSCAPVTPSSSSSASASSAPDTGTPEPFAGQVESIWCNSALAGPQGVLGGKIEVKREIQIPLDEAVSARRAGIGGEDQVSVRWGLWCGGQRVGRMGPPFEC